MYLKTSIAAALVGVAAIAAPAHAHGYYGPLPWWQHPPRMSQYYGPPYEPPPYAYAPPPVAVPVPVPVEPNPGLVLMQQALKSLPGIIAAAKMPPPAYAAVPPVAGVLPQPDPTIRWVQMALNTLVQAGLNTDGIAGPATTGAVSSYQAAHGLLADGIAGSATINMLTDNLKAAAALPPPPAE
jgi:hypothetical protein